MPIHEYKTCLLLWIVRSFLVSGGETDFRPFLNFHIGESFKPHRDLVNHAAFAEFRCRDNRNIGLAGTLHLLEEQVETRRGSIKLPFSSLDFPPLLLFGCLCYCQFLTDSKLSNSGTSSRTA